MVVNAASSSDSLLALKTSISFAHFDLAAWMVWIHEISDGGSLRHKLVHQLHSLSHRCWTKYGETGDIAAWLTEIRHQALPDGVAVSGEHDRNCLGCRHS